MTAFARSSLPSLFAMTCALAIGLAAPVSAAQPRLTAQARPSGSTHGNRQEPRAIRILREQKMKDAGAWRERAAEQRRAKQDRSRQ
jgi:hypothetical protein